MLEATRLADVSVPADALPNSEWRIIPSRELERLLQGELQPQHADELRELLVGARFDPQEGLTQAAAGVLSYERARFLGRELRISRTELQKDPRRLYALHEWLALVDGVACTVLSIHYCLALGSVLSHGEGRRELDEFVAELERMDSVGVFLATELGYGNNVAELETEARYDAARREFRLSSPTPQSVKFMPNTACAVPKLAVVMARLVTDGKNRGVFPFLVRLRDEHGVPCQGVQVTPLGEKPGYALDNAITTFDDVRVPKQHALLGNGNVLSDDGRFESKIASRRVHFLRAMDRVQTGRVCFTSAAVSVLRAATWIAFRYAARRLTFAPGKHSVSLLRYRNVQRDLFQALATAYALTFAMRSIQARFRRRTAESEDRCFREVAALKATATSDVADCLSRLRERCGAVGMLAENRLLEYWNQAQGIITAEGDNQLMLLKVGRKLFDDAANAGDMVCPPALRSAVVTPEQALSLLAFRERRLLDELREGVSRARRDSREPFAIWNANVNRTLALATAHGVRLTAGWFAERIADCREPAAAADLRSLFALWALERLERHAGWYASEGCVELAWLRDVPAARDALCAELEPRAARLVEAFGMDNSVLRAPIAEHDYIATYHARTRVPA